jgi:flagellar basal-body rod protein FlgF
MDRMIHTALNSIRNLYDIRFTTSQNLANMAVPGFRREMQNEGGSGFMLEDGQLSPRAFALEMGASQFSQDQGAIAPSDLSTDIALVNDTYFIVDPGAGNLALSRRGDLKTNADGQLIDGAGNIMMSSTMQPIEVPAFREIQVTQIGEILVNPLQAEVGQFISAGFISTTAPKSEMVKELDGYIRYADGTEITPDQSGKIMQNALESSNVNPIEELVFSMDMQRQFEINLKLISAAKELDEGGAQLLRLPTE